MQIVSSWVEQTPQETFRSSKPPTVVRLIFHVEGSKTHRRLAPLRRNITRQLQPSPGFRVTSVRRDLQPATVVSSLIRSVRTNPSPLRQGSRLAQLVVFLLTHPMISIHSITRNFKIQIETTGDVVDWSEHQHPPLMTAFAFDETLDFWSRSMAVEGPEWLSMKLLNISTGIEAPARYLPLIRFACDAPEQFLNFVADTFSLDIARTYGSVLAPLPHYSGIQLLLDEDNCPRTPRIRPVVQQVLDHSGVGSTRFFSHSQLDILQNLKISDSDVMFGKFTVCGESLFLFENGADLRGSNTAGLWPYFWSRPPLGGKALLLDSQEERFIPEGAAGFGRVDSNWFHLLIETLPRLVEVCDATSNEVPLLIQDRIPKTGLELIQRLIGPKRSIQQLSSNVIKVGTLHVVTGRTAVLDSPYLDRLTCSLEKQSLLKLRSKIWEAFPETSGPALPKSVIAIRNSHYRRLTNSQRVLRHARRHGFCQFDLGAQSVDDQIALFRNADEVIIQTGAGMANLLFSRPGTKVLGLVGPNKGQAKFWADFCDVLDLDSRFVIGEPAGRRNDNSAHADFRIPLPLLEMSLATAHRPIGGAHLKF